ncbi:PTS sugar transporter subunit IIA [Staphylococcus shinii]|jgi:mannitol/fructose-specific phosphotransferase system IIA component (Ntr-type)|uniref:PTS sugar transporter subunit IIA n=1 Tax=Staphylococcus shinii TaxID=2912228 RepID=UPI00298F3524|nr:PTS sugar transporter subunit IIA [Staphylococcus shinii]MDW8569738.1 PTS sugar transporter subunit IIA [Staphylococcus shinii]MDW8571683.1 PTS sugar transporter subunit IIA [Staphylococcus shinii]
MNEILFEITTKSNNEYKILDDIENLLIEEDIIDKKNTMSKDIAFRESKGNLEIYPKVILPHIKESYIHKTRIILVKNNSSPIMWQNRLIDLIILILMPMKAEDREKNLIRSFMKNLANEDYIKKLITKE